MIKKCLYRLSGLLLGVATLAGSLTSCQDDEFPYPSGPLTANTVKATLNSNTSSGLVQNEDGTWTATRRVPLVGAGRVLNNISPSLLEVAGWADDAQKVVDLDLNDGFDTGTAAVSAELIGNQIISVLDMGHVYAAGQKVGFAIKSKGNGVIDISVLKMFAIRTYQGGVETGHYVTDDTNVTVADVAIGNMVGGNTENIQYVEKTTTAPFDEVRLEIGGGDIAVANQLIIYYAYVGENPIIPAVNSCPESPLSSEYFGDKVGYKTGINWSSYSGLASLVKLIDEDLDNNIEMGVISKLFQPYMTVNFGHEIPAGSEVGFYVTSASLLKVSVGNSIEITTYDKDEKEVDNYTKSEILSLGLGEGGYTYHSIITTGPCQFIKIQFWGVNVDLGFTFVHYAYVREKTEIDVSSYFNLSDAVVYNPTYRFALPNLPKNTSVTYNLKSYPSRLDPKPKLTQSDYDGSWYLSGMNIAGEYVIEAIFTDEQGNTTTCQATIIRAVRDQQNCRTPLINPEEGEAKYAASAMEGFSGIVIGGGSDPKDYSAVVNHDQDDYIQTTEGSINLAMDQRIVSVSTINGDPINTELSDQGKRTRVGFVINKEKNFLDLDVLKFLRIRLFRGDEEVDSAVGDDNEGVSLGLIQAGSDTSKKTCLSIETGEIFDRIELWYTGLAGVNLGGTLQVFYAYIEDTESECANPGEECMQLITNANYGAVASVEMSSGINVGAGVGNMAFIVDDKIKTGADLIQVIDVAGANMIRVKFDPIKANQEVGFILLSTTDLANVSLINIMDIEACRNGESVGSTEEGTATGGALSLKVAGKGDYQYVSVTPAGEFDELILKSGSGIGALSNLVIHGVYILPDYNNDGVVDCIDDEATNKVGDLEALPADICEGESTQFKVIGGVIDINYTLTFNTVKPEGSKADPPTTTVRINELGYLDLPEDFIANLPADEYWISITPEGATIPDWNGTRFTVHPNETTWTGSISTDWNTWDNWTNGTPWHCTNVIIPSPGTSSPTYQGENITRYPILRSAEENAQCWNIHFEIDAELIGQRYLTYTGKALVDTYLEAGNYHLLSAPLQGMFTGDMFVLESQNNSRDYWATNWRNIEANGIHTNYFTVPIESNGDGSYPEHRIAPVIYQRFWSKTVSNMPLTRAQNADNLIMTDWSRTFNAVATEYERGQGFALKAEKEGNEEGYYFHFPKGHDTYSYYMLDGTPTGTTESIDRTNSGKLMQWTNQIVLGRETGEANGLFLFGNPYMAHINITKFLEANSENISRLVKVYNENNGSYEDLTSGQIAPMQAVFVQALANPEQGCPIYLTDDMFEQGNTSGNSYTQIPVEQLSLSVAAHGHTASCSVIPSASASDDYDVREDASLLVGSEEGSGVAVFTVAGGKALSIQRISQATRIPVGFYLREPGSVRLSFQAKDAYWDGWHLTDTRTGQTYPLDAAVTLEDVSTGSGRFFLEKAQ